MKSTGDIILKNNTPYVTILTDKIAFYVFSGLALFLKIAKKMHFLQKKAGQSLCTSALCLLTVRASAPDSTCLTASCSLGGVVWSWMAAERQGWWAPHSSWKPSSRAHVANDART